MKIKFTFLLFILFSCSAFAQCYTEAYTAYGTTIARRIDGTLWAKGFNVTGTAGTGNTTQQHNYIQISADNDWSENFCIGDSHALAIKNDGTLWVWGRNDYGCLGLGLTNFSIKVTPTQIGTDSDWAYVTADEGNSAAIKTNGTLWTWGNNQSGQLGIGSTVNFQQLTPIQVGSDTNWAKVFANDSTYFGIKADGTLWAWGSNGSGSGNKLGYTFTNPALDYASPHQVGTQNNWASVAVGQNMAIGLQSNGTLWAWGQDGSSQFGNGTNPGTPTIAPTPIQLGSDSDWAQISMSNVVCVALKTNGTRWGWGNSSLLYELGNGTSGTITVPTQVDNDTDWFFATIDSRSSIGGNGIKQDKSLYIWGYNIVISAPQPTPIREGEPCLLSNTEFSDGISVSAYPNPVLENMTIIFNLSKASCVAISVTNSLGQALSSTTFSGLAGPNNFTIEMGAYHSGMYIISVQTETHSKNIKVIKR